MSHKQYLLSLFATLTLLFLVFVFAEIGARYLPTPYMTKFGRIQRKDYRVVVLGSSHSYYGVNPRYFTLPTLNAANVSQDFKYDLFTLEAALHNNKDVLYVILPLSIFSFYFDLDDGIESWRKYNYRIYMGYKNYPITEKPDPRNYSVILASQSKLGMLKKLELLLTGHFIDQEWTDTGWGMDYSSAAAENVLMETGKSAAIRHQKPSKLSRDAIESVNKIAELCRDKGVKLLLFTPPAFFSYRKNIEPKRLETLTGFGFKLAEASPNIRYVSYYSDLRFESTDFHDADHLDQKGAEKLSQIIDKEIIDWK